MQDRCTDGLTNTTGETDPHTSHIDQKSTLQNANIDCALLWADKSVHLSKVVNKGYDHYF